MTKNTKVILASALIFSVLWISISVVQSLSMKVSVLDCLTSHNLTTCD
jgi:hypothetical protein